MIRVQWGNYMSEYYDVYNGVKQGGVISPILFIMYMDALLCKLASSKAGCHIGSTFCGALGYADDIVLLSPSLIDTKILLGICSEFAIEFDVMFNPSKSKLLLFGGINVPPGGVTFMGGDIDVVQHDNHLGNPIGHNSDAVCIDRAISDLYAKTNMIMCHFSYCSYQIKYQLFRTFCMPLYGCTLWNFTGNNINRFYTAWRKCVRRIIGVPYNTHGRYLHEICEDDPIIVQLLSRFIKFVKTIVKSDNHLSNICRNLALHGSRSSIPNTMSLVSCLSKMSKIDMYIKCQCRGLNNVLYCTSQQMWQE